MGFCAGAKDEVMNNHAIFGTVEKFAQRTADLFPSVIGRKVQAGAEAEYQHHDSIPEEVLKLLKPMTVYVSLSEGFVGYGLLSVSEEQCKIKTRHSMG